MSRVLFVIFFNDTATTEIYTLSLHDALPISAAADQVGRRRLLGHVQGVLVTHVDDAGAQLDPRRAGGHRRDRKSTRLNSSHANISYAVFCLKKKNKYKSSSCYDINL